jgi:hypothetical protein
MQVDTIQASLNPEMGDVLIKTLPGAVRNNEANIAIGWMFRHSNDLKRRICLRWRLFDG